MSDLKFTNRRLILTLRWPFSSLNHIPWRMQSRYGRSLSAVLGWSACKRKSKCLSRDPTSWVYGLFLVVFKFMRASAYFLWKKFLFTQKVKICVWMWWGIFCRVHVSCEYTGSRCLSLSMPELSVTIRIRCIFAPVALRGLISRWKGTGS